jgi:hypothetical protein
MILCWRFEDTWVRNELIHQSVTTGISNEVLTIWVRKFAATPKAARSQSGSRDLYTRGMPFVRQVRFQARWVRPGLNIVLVSSLMLMSEDMRFTRTETAQKRDDLMT